MEAKRIHNLSVIVKRLTTNDPKLTGLQLVLKYPQELTDLFKVKGSLIGGSCSTYNIIFI